jgi:dihydrofolate reductase
MRIVIGWNMVSVDGFFEGPNHDLGWFRFDDELESYIKETQKEAGTLLFGRVTYQMMADYWPSAEGDIARFMNSVEKVVFSKTLDRADWHNTRLVKGDVAEEVARIKRGGGGDIFVFGSAAFLSTLLDAGLVDECRLGINPVRLGSGTSLFKASEERQDWRLLSSKILKSGLVILHYQPTPDTRHLIRDT